MTNITERSLFQTIGSDSSAFIIDQQKDSPELTLDEKIEILSNLYQSKRMVFLIRYNNFLTVEQLEFIQSSTQDNEDIVYYIDRLLESKRKGNLIKQRRYSALQSLISEGDYFNDCNMRERAPHLYEQMVGKYLTEEERTEIEQSNRDPSEIQRPLSTFFLRQLEKNQLEATRLDQAHQEGYSDESNDVDSFHKNISRVYHGDEEAEEEEEDDDADDDADDDDDGDRDGQSFDDQPSASEECKIAQDEKDFLRKEFINIMYENFLAGKDEDFDYKTIDSNEMYDPINLLDRDAEDSYFDSEEPD